MCSSLGIVRILVICLLVSAGIAKHACPKPRVRREWRKFTPCERAEWIDAVKCLAALPHDPKLAPSVPINVSLIPPVNETSSFYDDLVYLHMDLNSKIHWTGLFLPWHRYYVHYFEHSLASRCGYNGTTPYWDWTLDAHDFYNSNIFDSSPSGFGGWGDPANDYQISTGGLKDIIMAYPSPHHTRRKFTLFPFANPNSAPLFSGDPPPPPLQTGLMINTSFTKEKVDDLVNNFEGDFIGFQTALEKGAGVHSGAHFILNGDMIGTCPNGAVPPACNPGPKWTPNDPLFFMHHGMIDKVWYDWQKKGPKNKYSYGGGSVTPIPSFTNYTRFPTGLPPYLNFDSEIPGDGLWENVTIWDVIDTTGDPLCYVYV